MTTATRYDAANTHSGQSLRRLRSTDFLPRWPAFSVQPDVGSRFRPVRQDSSMTAFGLAAPHTTAWCRRSRISVQPLNNAANERLSLGLGARQSTVEFHNSRPFVEERLPVLRRPAVAAGSQHSYDLCFVLRQYLQDGAGWQRGCLQHQVVTVDFEVNTDSASCLQSLGCAHSRPLQPVFLKLGESSSLTGISFPPFPSFPISPLPGSRSGECGECGECLWRASAKERVLGDELAVGSCPDADTRIWYVFALWPTDLLSVATTGPSPIHAGRPTRRFAKSFPILRAVGRSNRLPTSSPNASQMGFSASSGCISSIMAFTTSIDVKVRSPQISSMIVSAIDTADASSSSASPARINSVQFTVVPIRLAAYSVDHPTKFHQVLNRVLTSCCLGRFRAPATSSV